MCSVNDKIKENLRTEIGKLETEVTANQAVIDDAKTSIEELNEANSEGNCATEALGQVSLGSNSVLNNLNKSMKEVDRRLEMLKNILEEAQNMQTEIENKLEEQKRILAETPENCGSCMECDPEYYKRLNERWSNIG